MADVATGKPKLAQTVALKTLQDCVLYAGNVFGDPAKQAGATASLSKEGAIHDPNLHDVHLPALIDFFSDFYKVGYPIVNGIVGVPFNEEDSRRYTAARKFLEDNGYGSGSSLVTATIKILKDTEAGKYDEELLSYVRDYRELGERATILATNRMESLERLISLQTRGGVTFIRGATDRAKEEWEFLKEKGHMQPIKLSEKEEFKVAYFGGYNYSKDRLQFAPDEVSETRLSEEDIYKFLTESKDFDMLIFNGELNRLYSVINKINNERAKKRWFRQGLIKDKLIVISDPLDNKLSVRLEELPLHVTNVVVSGVNYYNYQRMLLVNPRTKRLAIVAPATAGENPLNHEFRIAEAHCFKDGKLISNVDLTQKLESDTSITSVVRKSVARSVALVSANKQKIGNAAVTALKYGVVATIGAAAGVFGASLLSETGGTGNEENAKIVREQQEIIVEYESLFKQYLDQREKKK